jgi:hypothetical protein
LEKKIKISNNVNQKKIKIENNANEKKYDWEAKF